MILRVFVAAFVALSVIGQEPPSAQTLSPQQLDDLVAPIALYPDNLLSQIMVASTYPLEVVEAQQWLQQHRNQTGKKLMDEAQKQKWDPSVQALVAFPEVLTRLNQDVRWTTDLGNAFLAQQGDVMQAVQRLRAKAQANGKLAPTPQENVKTETQNGQNAGMFGCMTPGTGWGLLIPIALCRSGFGVVRRFGAGRAAGTSFAVQGTAHVAARRPGNPSNVLARRDSSGRIRRAAAHLAGLATEAPRGCRATMDFRAWGTPDSVAAVSMAAVVVSMAVEGDDDTHYFDGNDGDCNGGAGGVCANAWLSAKVFCVAG